MSVYVSKMGEPNGRPSILILHGWGASHKSWMPIQKGLADLGYNVIVPDMPGFGGTNPPDKAWTTDDYASWVLHFIEDQNIKTPFYLAGHSFGGALAIKIAAAHPSLIKGLVLVAPSRVGPRSLSRWKKALKTLAKMGKLAKSLPGYNLARKAFYKFLVKEYDYIKTVGVMTDTFEHVLKDNLVPILKDIKAPTLIIWGEKDRATPVEGAYIIKREVKTSKLHVIPNGFHNLQFQHPHELIDLIYKFIKSV